MTKVTWILISESSKYITPLIWFVAIKSHGNTLWSHLDKMLTILPTGYLASLKTHICRGSLPDEDKCHPLVLRKICLARTWSQDKHWVIENTNLKELCSSKSSTKHQGFIMDCVWLLTGTKTKKSLEESRPGLTAFAYPKLFTVQCQVFQCVGGIVEDKSSLEHISNGIYLLCIIWLFI